MNRVEIQKRIYTPDTRTIAEHFVNLVEVVSDLAEEIEQLREQINNIGEEDG